jgi:hypothetical protein
MAANYSAVRLSELVWSFGLFRLLGLAWEPVFQGYQYGLS